MNNPSNLKNLKMLTETRLYSEDFSLPDYPLTPDGKIDREAMIQTLLEEEYGYVDDADIQVSYETVSDEADMIAGKCRLLTLRCILRRKDMTRSFPFQIYIPYGFEGKRTVVHLNFSAVVPGRYIPIEELLDMGLTVAYIYYKDVSSDDGDFENGIAPLLTDRQKENSAGKIAIWSYAARRVADYLLESGIAVKGRLGVIGHSRLGKTALLTGALDTRFSIIHDNCSGCSGSAVARETTGETVADIMRVFPFWFCRNYEKYVHNESAMPFDQHFLIAAISPRRVAIVAAEKDAWANPDAQYLAAEAASVAYEEAGVIGLDEKKGILRMGESSTGGEICFKKRYGTHFLSREDWQFFNKIFTF